jgi:putative flippase GtrA
MAHSDLHKREFAGSFFRLGMLGLLGILVNIGILFVLNQYTSLAFYLTAIVSIGVSLLLCFFIYDGWIGHHERSGNLFQRFSRFLASTSFSFILVAIILLQLFKDWVGMHYLIATSAALVFALISQWLIFANRPSEGSGFHFPKPVLWVMVISLILRLLIGASTGAGFDEAYYYAYSIRPSLSYFDHPPLVGFLAGFFPYLLNHTSPFTIRLGAIILFTASGLFFYLFVRQNLDERSSFLAYVFFNLIPLFFLLAGSVIIPDAGLVFFWILALFPFRKIFYGQDSLNTWIVAGLTTGFAMLSKYHGILLGFSLLLVLIFYRPKLFLTPKPYVYALFAFIPILPVIIWNIQHEFISFTFQGNRAIGDSISALYLLQALAGQLAYVTPMAFIPFAVVIWQSIQRGFGKKDKDQQFYFIFGSLHVLLFLVLSLFTPILPHWTLPGYILLLVPFTNMIRSGLERLRWARITFRVSILLVAILLMLAFSHTKWGVLSKNMSSNVDVSLDLVGWESIPGYLEEMGVDEEEYFLFSHKWFLCGEIELATRGKYPVKCFNKDDPRGYGIWNKESDMLGKDGLFICSDRYFHDPVQSYRDYFQSVSPPDSVVIHRRGIPVKTLYFFRCNDLVKNYPTAY